MKFRHLLLFGVLCTTITLLNGEDVKKDLKNINNNKKATNSEKKFMDKKANEKQASLQDSSSSSSSSSVASSHPVEDLPDIGTPEYETFPDDMTDNITEPSTAGTVCKFGSFFHL